MDLPPEKSNADFANLAKFEKNDKNREQQYEEKIWKIGSKYYHNKVGLKFHPEMKYLWSFPWFAKIWEE